MLHGIQEISYSVLFVVKYNNKKKQKQTTNSLKFKQFHRFTTYKAPVPWYVTWNSLDTITIVEEVDMKDLKNLNIDKIDIRGE